MSEITIIKSTSLGQFINDINQLDPDRDKLYLCCYPDDVVGKIFTYENNVYEVTDIDSEDNEEPLLSAFLHGYSDYDNSLDDIMENRNEDLQSLQGYYSGEIATPFRSNYVSHTDSCFCSGEYYAWNIPKISNKSVVGFYWLPLTCVMDILREA